jgi:hypothetical protein
VAAAAAAVVVAPGLYGWWLGGVLGVLNGIMLSVDAALVVAVLVVDA